MTERPALDPHDPEHPGARVPGADRPRGERFRPDGSGAEHPGAELEAPVSEELRGGGTRADHAPRDDTARDDSARDDAAGEAGQDGSQEPVSDVSAQLPGAGPVGERPPLAAVLEAVLLVTDEPVAAVTLATVADAPVEEVEATLEQIASDLRAQRRGFELRLVAGGWRLYTRSDCAAYVERFLLDGQSARLTQAALETLAVIAYRQPVTRSRVSAVRGVNVDGVVRTLQARGLITDAGQDADSAGTLFRTTPLFLERLGLRSLDELPSLAPFLPELDELEDASTST
jgi:segregation and condensation protein B